MTTVAGNTGIPQSARLGFTAWVILWAGIVFNRQGPQNFFWLCNMAQFIILYAIWRRNRLLLLVVYPLIIYFPGHFLVRAILRALPTRPG